MPIGNLKSPSILTILEQVLVSHYVIFTPPYLCTEIGFPWSFAWVSNLQWWVILAASPTFQAIQLLNANIWTITKKWKHKTPWVTTIQLTAICTSRRPAGEFRGHPNLKMKVTRKPTCKHGTWFYGVQSTTNETSELPEVVTSKSAVIRTALRCPPPYHLCAPHVKPWLGWRAPIKSPWL